jgi:hypothetical protein
LEGRLVGHLASSTFLSQQLILAVWHWHGNAGGLRSMKTARGLMGLWLVIALGLLPDIGDAQPDKIAYELQERCASSARDFFARHYKGEEELPSGIRGTEYENHYSSRYNKCYILVHSTLIIDHKKAPDDKASLITEIVLTDALSNKLVGDFLTSDHTYVTFTGEMAPSLRADPGSCHSR